QNQPRRDDFGLKIGKLSHRTSIKDGLGRHIGSCGPLNRNFLKVFSVTVFERASEVKIIFLIVMWDVIRMASLMFMVTPYVCSGIDR
ncbi:hypothetical protein, partial [Escherichia coli]|uniref:hypothetical protein n=1 Tax=Escherichia coli TaxID=562 RepID=UPI001ADD8F10